MAENFDKLMSVFQEALEKYPPEEWDGFVREASGDDEELYRQACQLLQAHAYGDSLLDRPAVAASRTLDEPITEKPGAQIGPYKLLQQIGEGGMGVVFMAEQSEPLQRTVALKIIKPGMDTRQVIARFEAERQAVAMMDHPNIAKVLDAGATDSGRPYFVMELVKGVPITKYCDEKHLPLPARLELFVEVCQAVQHAHQKGIIHRDIKPNNVLVAEYDNRAVPKVIDFGVAKATAHRLTERTMFTELGQVLGTLEYMSPEQSKFNQRDIDTRSDIYSLGVLLFELLTGSTPFQAERLEKAAFDETLRIIREEQPPRPSLRISTSEALASLAANRSAAPAKLSVLVCGQLDWIVLKALEKDRDRRFESAALLAADLQAFLADAPVKAAPPSMGYRARKYFRKHRGPMIAAATVAAILIAAIIAVSGQQREIYRQRETTTAANTFLDKSLVDRFYSQLNLAQKAVDENRFDEATCWCWRAYQTAPQARPDLKTSARALLGAWAAETMPVYLHDGWALAKFSPDGQTVLTGSGDNSARLWDVRTGRPRGDLLRHNKGISSLAFSPDGRMALTGSFDGTARLWSARDGRSLGQEFTHKDYVCSVAFSPDGRTVVIAGGRDGTARLWDLNTRQPRGESMPHNDVVEVVISPDGETVITLSLDGTALFWNAQTGKPRGEPQVQYAALAVAFSPDGHTMLTGSEDGTARLWDANTGKPRGEPLRRNGAIFAVAYSPDGQTVLTASRDKTAQFWDVQTCRKRGEALQHSDTVLCVAFSPDGSLALTGSVDKTARFWDVRTGQAIGDPLKHDDTLTAVAFSPNGQLALTASDDHTARLWDVPPAWPRDDEPVSRKGGLAEKAIKLVEEFVGKRTWAAERPRLQGPKGMKVLEHNSVVAEVAFSPDGQTVLTGSWDGTARLWDAVTGKPRGEPLNHGGSLHVARFSPNGQEILTAGSDKTARLWNVNTRQVVGDAMAHVSGVSAGTFSPDGRKVLTGSIDGTAQLWDAQTCQQLSEPLNLGGWVNSVAFSPDGEILLARNDDGESRLWNANVGKNHPTSLNAEVTGSILAFSPDGQTVLTSFKDDTMQLREIRTGKPLGVDLKHDDRVWAVAFSSDGSILWTRSADGTARIWDASTGRLLGQPLKHEGSVRAVALSPDSRTAITGSGDGLACVWDVNTGHLRGKPVHCDASDNAVVAAAFSPNGRVAVVGSKDYTARLWSLTAPAKDEPERLQLSVEVRTGLHFDERGFLKRLDVDQWTNRRHRLDELGGFCDVGDWSEQSIGADLSSTE